MRSAETTYRLIDENNGPEIPAIKFLWKKHGMGAFHKLGFPTIVAERDKTIIGFISTYPSIKVISAGPLVVDVDGNKSPVALRLVDFYERILVAAGVSEYLFNISREAAKAYAKAIERYGLTPYREDEKHLYFVRELHEQRSTVTA